MSWEHDELQTIKLEHKGMKRNCCNINAWWKELITNVHGEVHFKQIQGLTIAFTENTLIVCKRAPSPHPLT